MSCAVTQEDQMKDSAVQELYVWSSLAKEEDVSSLKIQHLESCFFLSKLEN